MKACGTVFKYGDNIDTDVIIPARYLNSSDPKELAQHCMEDAIHSTVKFAENVKDGDIIVAEKNFGCGSSREHAPIAIKASGISCVIAKTFARIFYRNAINIGLPILECEEAANDIDQPKYDTQKDIYYTIFEELKDAVSKLDESAANNVGSYDLIYGGDATKWKKFANSIRLRMAVRISDVDAAKAKTEAAAAISAGVFSSDADAAFLTQGEDKFAQNPIYYHKGSSVLHMSTAYKRLVEGIGGQAWPTAADREANKNITEVILTAKNTPAVVDPRAPIHFEPAGIIESPATPSMNGNWDGTDPGHVASGVGAAMDNGQFVSDFSKIGPWYYETIDRKYPLFKYSELCFLKAIAIELGLASGDAKTEYEAGVRSSMTELGVPENKIANYLASTSPNYYGTTAKYDDVTGTNNTPMDKILTQKYIAQFQECSFETWADHRQFHKPTLMPFASVSSSVFNMNPSDQANNTPNAYIKRIYYPSSEYTVNEANVKEAEKRMGGSNSIQNNLWWDVN